MTPRPFADAVIAYAQAGWPCILPVPPEKSPPPVGFTGADGRDTDPNTLAGWVGEHLPTCRLAGRDACQEHGRSTYSIALRMPDGVIGIDVDAYTKAGVVKHGAKSLATALEHWGTLPATWSSTARGDGPSRISFYRVPRGRYATKLPGGDVEIIQRHHRYAVVWPSPHLDAGDIYRWYDPAGAAVETPPKPDELPLLPQAWVDGLREGATEAGPAASGIADGQALLSALLADDRPACAEITSAALTAIAELSKADAGSRHDTAVARVHHLVQLAASGHPGLPFALPDLAARWAELTAGEDRGEEWERMLLTSARKAVTAVGTRQVSNDPCLVIGSIPIAAPAPADDRPGAEPVTPIEPPRALNPMAVIGTHLFDPRGHLDQIMAQAVLERTHPLLRYAVDAKTWLRRGPEFWEQNDALADWAVSLLAWIMPDGDPDAEKGSDARDQAERRKRFMSAAPASAIGKKLRSLVADSAHPCSVKIAELDREPWLLWAGGVGWDLRASHVQPTAAALIDPATPHLHSAGVAPEIRPTPLWDAFTAAVWPDEGLRAWALRVLSIALTGYSDKALPILVGDRDRGKTQAVMLIMSVLGTYAHAADPRLLNNADNTHASIVYALMGRRLSFIDEGPRGAPSSQERLKQLTGAGDLTGNVMRGNPVTFRPTHTLILTANDEPLLTDPAVRGRVRLIPCEGDPVEVIAARRAIGNTSDTAWQREAPGVLAALMREAAAWLADPRSALTEAAPEAYRYRAEEIAAEQDPIREWLEEETEADEFGERSRGLYEAFVGWSRNGNVHPARIPTETKWGRDLTRHGYPPRHARDGKRRPLRLRPRGLWVAGPTGDGLTGHSDGLPISDPSPMEAPETGRSNDSVTGVTGSITVSHTREHHIYRNKGKREVTRHPSQAESAKITASLLQAKAKAATPHLGEPALDALAGELAGRGLVLTPGPAAKPKRTRLSDEEKAARAAERLAARAAAKAAELDAKIAEAAGELLTLPAVVTADGRVSSITLTDAATLLEALGAFAELTVDVEHTGFPVGHADYALRTIQLGNEHAALVLDAADPEHRELARTALAAAAVLHAHSATADLVPLAVAGVIDDLEHAWARMHDTAIPAKLADPSSTGNDADLKKLAGAVLGPWAKSPAAGAARGVLFKTAKWLTETKATTPLERAGWAQVDPRCLTMVRYAASDVLDDAALAKRLPAVDPAVLERERTAQRMTARVAYRGLRLDGAHVDSLLPHHRAQLAMAAERLRAFGVDNPGSDQQVGAVALQLGAQLPRTKTGRPSVAAGVLEPCKAAPGPLGEFVRARLDYQHHETAIGLFLEPYAQLVHRGDGRARPTVYTLGADTGRMSCVRPNLQQMPREGGFRACITADPGELLISADFAGVELRVAAALSGDENLRAMLAAGVDVHGEIAKLAFGPDATKADRYATKRGVFGRIYGGGIPAIARGVGVSETTAAAIVDALDAMLPGLAAWSHSIRQAVANGHTQFPTYAGRVIHLPAAFPHKAPNYCIQGTARELLIDTLMRWQDTRWGTATLLPVHDELVVTVPEDEAAAATAALIDAMQTELYGVAIRAEASEPSFAWKDAI